MIFAQDVLYFQRKQFEQLTTFKICHRYSVLFTTHSLRETEDSER